MLNMESIHQLASSKEKTRFRLKRQEFISTKSVILTTERKLICMSREQFLLILSLAFLIQSELILIWAGSLSQITSSVDKVELETIGPRDATQKAQRLSTKY